MNARGSTAAARGRRRAGVPKPSSESRVAVPRSVTRRRAAPRDQERGARVLTFSIPDYGS